MVSLGYFSERAFVEWCVVSVFTSQQGVLTLLVAWSTVGAVKYSVVYFFLETLIPIKLYLTNIAKLAKSYFERVKVK